MHRRRHGFAAALLAAMVSGAGVMDARADTPPLLAAGRNAIGIDQRIGAAVPLDLEFTDADGAPVTLRQYFDGRPVVLNLVYHRCPSLCSMVVSNELRALNTLTWSAGDEFSVITVSIDPREALDLAQQKRAAILSRYRRPSAATGWHFLTGSKASIDALASAVGFRYVADPISGQFAHAAGIMVLTGRGVVSRYLLGVEYSGRELRLALVEAADNRLGSVVDDLLLECFVYDPARGRYSLAILNVLRGAGLLTVALLAAYVFAMLRRERRRAHEVPRVSDVG